MLQQKEAPNASIETCEVHDLTWEGYRYNTTTSNGNLLSNNIMHENGLASKVSDVKQFTVIPPHQLPKTSVALRSEARLLRYLKCEKSYKMEAQEQKYN